MNWKELCTEYETELRNGPTNSTAATVFTSKTDEGNKRWKDLKVRVVEHVSIYGFFLMVVAFSNIKKRKYPHCIILPDPSPYGPIISSFHWHVGG